MVENDRPLCRCHLETMTLRNDRKVGYRCSVGHREAQETYRYTTKGMKTDWANERRRLGKT